MNIHAARRAQQTARSQATLRRRLLPVLVASCFGSALANPFGPQVVNGQASFLNQGNVLSVTNTPGTIINWQGFSINAGELTRFIQQNPDSAVLNRITGQDPSQILGALQSNGRVFIVNPNGILFGQGAQVDVNGLVASTLNISNEDFLSGKMLLKAGDKAGNLKNEGAIKTPAGGQVFLIAPNVENSGIITSPKGEVMLAAGHTVQLVDSLNPELRVVLSAPENEALNLGQVIVSGGKASIYGALVKQRGVINADSAVVGENGKVVLKASRDTLLEAGSRTSARGAGKGGEIQVLGERVALTGDAQLDASGNLGGGTVLVGGDYQGKNPDVQNAKRAYFGKDAGIHADAVESGDGGKIIVWADEDTRAYGNISARAGAAAGNGGFVEVSGKRTLDFLATVDTSAARGKYGTLLLDPTDINIVAGSAYTGTPGSLAASPANSGGAGDYLWSSTEDLGAAKSIGVSDIATLLASSNLELQATNDINWASGAPLTYGGVARTFTLKAGNNISLQSNITSSANALNVNLYSTGGGISLSGATINANGGQINLFALSDVNMNNSAATTSGNVTLIGGWNGDTGTPAVTGAGGVDLVNSYAEGGNVTLKAGTGGIAVSGTVVNPLSNSLLEGNITLNSVGNIDVTRFDGNITAHATGAGSTIQLQDAGALVVGASGISTNNGNITLNAPAGMLIVNGAVSAGTGTVSLNANGAGYGVTLSAAVSGANIDMTGDSMDIQSGATVTGSAAVTLKPKTSLQAIKVGVTSGDDAAGALRLSQDEIDRISTAKLRIGDTAATGNLDVVSSLTPSGTSMLILQAGGEIKQDAGAKIIIDKLGLRSLTKVHLMDENMVNYVAGVTGDMITNFNKNFSFNNVTSGLTVGSSIDGMSGITATMSGTYSTGATGVITLKSAGALLQEAGALLSGKAVFAEGSKVVLEQVNPTGIIAGKSTGTTSGDTFSYKSNNGIVTVTDAGYTGIQSATPVGFTGVKLQSTTNNITVSSPINAGLGNVILSASGAINGSGLLTAHDLSASASGGIALSNTKVKTLAAVNSGANSDISIANVSSPDPLYLYNVSQSTGTGNITITNTGPIIVDADYTVSTGAGNITLKSNPTGSSSDTLTISGGVNSTTGNITLEAGSTISGNSATTGSPGTVTVLANKNATASSGGSSEPPAPSLTDCTSNPTLSGCSTVLPTLGTCTIAPTTAGCTAVLPTVEACSSNPSLSGCSAVLPTLDACVAAPSTAGCAVVLPTADACAANPALAGCSVVSKPPTIDTCIVAPTTAGCSTVLPTFELCTTAPSTPGCIVVLPPMDICLQNPTTAGCNAVLPPVSACTINPTQAGCSVVLPPLSTCIATPNAAGCSVVLPSMSICTTAPTTAGCTAVLPTLAQCSANPAQEGCSVVVPTASKCVTNPSAPECQTVLPTTGTSTTATNTVTETVAETTNTVVTTQASVLKSQPGSGGSSGGSSQQAESDSKKDEKKTTSTTDDSGVKKNEPAKKMYCN
ncbi:filamentous hemagglutinin N-terminal domain-containing protein [Noviherbaspirillum sp. ST9]|uniref:two-partner secretion domain-containing protein n=1 Tax=Noviherbaspirillum sp. ST9 TaxID=3401606 RepID=UPI003B588D03